MKNLYSLALLLSLFCTGLLNAQTRYLGPVFGSVNFTDNVTYGVNATVLYYSVFGQAVPQALKLDVYQPGGDTETKRPLVIYLHTGNFLPFYNPSNPTQAGFNGSCGGTRNDSACVEICTRLAKMGYVAASADYRLGWNPLAATDVDRQRTEAIPDPPPAARTESGMKPNVPPARRASPSSRDESRL